MINSIANNLNSAIFLRIFDDFFFGFRAKFQKIVTCVAFQSNLRKQIRNFPKILNFVKITRYHSKLFPGVLSMHRSAGGREAKLVDRSGAAGRQGSTPARHGSCSPLNFWHCDGFSVLVIFHCIFWGRLHYD